MESIRHIKEDKIDGLAIAGISLLTIYGALALGTLTILLRDLQLW